MNLIQMFAVCTFVMPVEAPQDAGFPQVVETAIEVPEGEDSAPVARSQPDARISIGIDPLEWIRPNRY